MELALLPIAAVLLLLSGASAPAQALTLKVPGAALMRQFLAANGPAVDRFSTSRSVRRSQPLLRRHAKAASPRSALHLASVDSALRPTSVRGTVDRFDRKLYRTRFGFANGAYQATAPPLA